MITVQQLADIPDATRTLELLVDGRIANPTDLGAQLRINARYARELMGLLVAHGLAQVNDHGDEYSWEPTERGERLAPDAVAMVQWNRKGGEAPTTGQTGGTMAQTKGATKGAKTKTVKAVKAKVQCACGCGGETGRVFAQGHDAKMVSQSAKAVTTEAEAATKRAEIAKQFGDKLAAKFESAAANVLAKASAKADRATARAAKAATGGSKAKATAKVVTAKVGRFERTGTVQRDGSFKYADAKGATKTAAKGKYSLV